MESRWIWPFEILNKLGEGGMGVVYRARYVRNNRQVAVKLLPEDAAENKTLLARFEREMEVLKGLDHPNIVRCFGGTCEGQKRFYAMELVDNGTLAELIRRKERLSWDVAIDYAIQMCDALQYAHERGVIHRDVKPSNFLLTKQGQIKLSDFGLVTVVAGRKLTASGRTLGTVDYMSPEQIRGNPLTNRSDLYALGCVIHEMLIGHSPYSGESTVEIMHKHLSGPIPHIVRSQSEVPLELDQLVCELLAKTPDLRPESAGAVSRRLKEILQPGRHASAAEPTLFPTRMTTEKLVSKLEVTRSSGSHEAIADSVFRRYSSRGWLMAACLAIASVIGWSSWSVSSSRLLQAERVLADDLSATDLPTQVYAAKALARIEHLHASTISKLNAATKGGADPMIVASLNALARHANQCRSLQWEIYKIQQNTQVSSEARSQAAATVEAIQKSGTRSTTWGFALWSVLFIFGAIAIAGVGYFRYGVHTPRKSLGIPAAAN